MQRARAKPAARTRCSVAARCAGAERRRHGDHRVELARVGLDPAAQRAHDLGRDLGRGAHAGACPEADLAVCGAGTKSNG